MKTDTKQEKIVRPAIKVNGNLYYGKDHREAINNAKKSGEDVSKVNRERDGLFETSLGKILNREQAKESFGIDKSENMDKQKPRDFSEIMTNKKSDMTFGYFPDVLNIIWWSCDGVAFSIAHKLIQEGNNVIVVQVQEKKGEDEESKKRRLSVYDGMLSKISEKEALKFMEKIENKKDWIVFFDFNELTDYSEKALEMGFTKGLFPTADDLALEEDRNAMKEIVKKEYPELTLGEVNEYSSVDDAIEMLNETDKVWVLKGSNENSPTVVPDNNDPELSKQTLIDALEAHRKDYEDGGFILEEKIVDMLEITPQIVFLDGKVVFTDIDFENKPIGAGNNSVQTGAMQSLVVKSKPKDKINDIAFPDWVYKRAKEHTGLFVFDASMLVKDGIYYFGEVCSQRFGYDSFFAEIAMAESATNFFTDMFNGKNPLRKDFGVAVRGLNMHKDAAERRVLTGISMSVSDEENTFIFDCKEEDGKYVTCGTSWDMVVFTGASDEIEEATDIAYEALDGFAFEAMYSRPKFDMLSFDYTSSIPNRYMELNHDLFNSKDMEDSDKITLKRLSDKIDKALKD